MLAVLPRSNAAGTNTNGPTISTETVGPFFVPESGQNYIHQHIKANLGWGIFNEVGALDEANRPLGVY